MVKTHPAARTHGVLHEVVGERCRQDARWGVQNHTGQYWIAILGEEFGEVCKAILEQEVVDLRAELIQVAAVAVAAVESLDRQGVTRQPYPGEGVACG